MQGLAASGLAMVAEGGIEGIAVGGLAVVGERRIRGAALSLGAVESEGAVSGLAVGGYRVRAPSVNGIALSVAQLRVDDLAGLGVGAYTRVRGVQRGLSIAVYNHATELHGLQLGLINRADNHRGAARILPILNFHR